MTMMTFKGQGGQRPTAMGSLLQSSAYGATIPTIYGLTQSNLLAIWAANLRQGGGGTKKFKQLKKGITNYCENIDFLLGHNPIKGVLQVMNNGSNSPLAFTSQTFSGSGGRQSFAVTDPHFYFVIAVTVEASYSFDVDDYGSQGPATLAGTWEVPLWNELETGPDPTDPTSYRAWPYCYRWQPGMGATIEIDAESFPSGSVKIYYAQMTAATSYQPPTARLALEFEPHLGSGDEYANAGSPYDTQQIIYPQFAGLQSSEIDLGSSGALPQLNPEVCGKWGVYSSGDADFVDMIEDIFKSGLAQAGIVSDSSTQPEPAGTQMERGLSSYDLPGTIQKKVDAHASVSLPPMTYDMPNAQGNILIAIVTGSGTLAISSANAEDWTAVYGDGLGYQVWYATAAGGPNVVTVTGASAPWEMAALEIGGCGPANPYTGTIIVNPTISGAGATGTGTATAYADPTGTVPGTCGLSVTGLLPPVTAADRGEGIASWSGFIFDPTELPAGATVTKIAPTVVISVDATECLVPNSLGILLPSDTNPGPPSNYTGTYTGVIIPTFGQTVADAIAAWTPEIRLDYSLDGAIFGDTLGISAIYVEVQYTIPSSPLTGDTIDAVVTASSGSPTVNSTVAPGLPGYLLTIALYPPETRPLSRIRRSGGRSRRRTSYGNSTGSFQAQERVIYSPGSYVAPAGSGSRGVGLPDRTEGRPAAAIPQAAARLRQPAVL